MQKGDLAKSGRVEKGKRTAGKAADRGVSMITPPFFARAQTITVRDPLAELLGAAAEGVIEYSYLDAVKLAGHSCPTVAGAYLMTMKALRALYPDSLPQRGGIRVEFREPQAAGVTGVMAAVAGLITGAAQEGGFKGIAGRFDRRNLLFFGRECGGEVRFTRLDTQAAVEASYHPQAVPPAAEIPGLVATLAAGDASPTLKEEFSRLWQDRVRRILVDHADLPGLVVVSPVTAFA